MLPNQQRTRRRAVPSAHAPFPSPRPSLSPVIPYDYAATFELRGIPGNIVQDVINVSVDGVFVATAVGYGLEEERGRTIDRPIRAPSTFKPGEIALDAIPPELLITGFRLDPKLGPMVFPDQHVPAEFRRTLFQRVKPAEEISFLFSIVDSATG